MLTQDATLGRNDQPVGIYPQADRPVGKRRRNTVAIALKTDQTGVRQLDVGHLQLGAFTAQNRKILAPVELESIAGIKMQRNKGSAPRRLLFALAI